MVYCLSFSFESHSTAQIVVMVLNLIMGFVTVIAHFVMSTLPSTQAGLRYLVITPCPARRPAYAT